MSLRTHLLAASTVTLAAGMAVLCLAGNALLAQTIHRDASQQLAARVDTVVASISVDHGQLTENTTLNDSTLDAYAWVARADGKVLETPTSAPPALQHAALALARAGENVQRPGPSGHLLASRPLYDHGTRLGTVVADLSTSTLDALQRRVMLGSIVVALLTLLVSVLAIRRALNAALAPVDQMTRDAEAWGAHDLDRRFDLGPPSNEISALAAMLDRLLDRIAASRRHEQRFAAEVAHELRTPLAAIRGVAELATDAPDIEETWEALAQIETQSRRIAGTLDTLIAFARRESSPAIDGVDLEAVAADFDGIEIHRTDAPLPRVEGDPAMIRQALAPLIDNARRHAVKRVTVELAGSADRAVVTVRDDGPGVDPRLGERAFLPGIRGDTAPGDGAGLGLPLARRLAHSCGGDLALGDGPGGCFVLTLRAR